MATTQKDNLVAQHTIQLRRATMLLDQCDREQRGLTPDEEKQHKAWLDEIKHLEGRISKIDSDAEMLRELDRVTNGYASGDASAEGTRRGVSPGTLFADGSREFFKAAGHRVSGVWRSPTVEIPYGALLATTLTEGAGSGGALVIPDYRPGIIPSATRPIVVMDLLMPGSTSSNVVAYMQETTFTNAAAATLEGAAKPESALTFAQVNEPTSKIAHWLPCTEELLEDAPGISSYIDGRLRLGVQLAEDDELLNGSGVAPHFKGLLNRAGLAATVVQGATESAADAILRQIAAIATTAYIPPTGIIMNPADWFAMQILKATTGEYIGASPFETPVRPSLWGLPVAVTTGIVAKTALVGAFSTQVQFFRRGGLRVESSNSHQDFFIKNLVAIRAEERGALAVYRPGSLGKVTLL